MLSVKEQLQIIKRGAVDIISEEELVKKLELSVKNKIPLKIKAGFDPTAPDIHLGHTVLLRKMRQFQDLGHEVYFLIGDFTARIGDPSGRSKLRKQLTKEEAAANALTYKKQISKVLDISKLKIVFNSDWFDKMPVLELLKLTTHATVSQMLARADFKKRLTKNEDISLIEFMYPILQGYDSVKLEADVELGGTDQIFNLLVGRDMQLDYKQSQQVVLTMPLLEGTDGMQKMSKSYDNYVGISDSPNDMFGKIMSIPDDLMMKYYMLLTDKDLEEVKQIHPKEAKVGLARDIISQYYSPDKAKEAANEFERIFSNKETPKDMPVYELKKEGENIIDVLVNSHAVKTRNEARRLIQQRAVTFEGVKLEKEEQIINECGIIKAGKRFFLKVSK